MTAEAAGWSVGIAVASGCAMLSEFLRLLES